MTTNIRETGLNCPDATYEAPAYKEAGMNFTNLVRTMLNDYGVYHVQFNTKTTPTGNDGALEVNLLNYI